MCKVGIFDSGLGGFSLLSSIFKRFPDWEIFYIADQAYGPYGSKSADVIKDRSEHLTRVLLEKSVDLVIVACNTATALAIETLRDRFEIPFVGIEPYLNVINRHPELVESGKGVVLSTAATNESLRLKELRKRLDPDSVLDYVGVSNLASIVEAEFGKNNHDELEKKVRSELYSVVTKNYDFAILGCTHYPLISNLIETILELKSYSPDEFVINRAAQLLEEITPENSRQLSHRSFYFLSTSEGQWKILDHSYIKCF